MSPFVAEDAGSHMRWVGSNRHCSRGLRVGFKEVVRQPLLPPGQLRLGSAAPLLPSH